ncbi:hypothetical protein B9Z55_022893 [Caenorhabditis nigoni]|uniref:Uncharacterized protein n=1 Tax=Caenorhabditis nigoni TaxID=1611254 RepID=A0A2G5SM53_9PELO|nr:hypothetical protein B9Z55_022893 [Caenorhabditis nigoni]
MASRMPPSTVPVYQFGNTSRWPFAGIGQESSSLDPPKCDRYLSPLCFRGPKRGIQEAITSKPACAEIDADTRKLAWLAWN